MPATRIDATIKGNRITVSVVGLVKGTVQVRWESRTTGGTEATFTIERSADGVVFEPLEGSVPDITGEGISDTLNFEGFSFLRVRVLTADSQSLARALVTIAGTNPNQVAAGGVSSFRDLLNQGPQTMPGNGIPIDV